MTVPFAFIIIILFEFILRPQRAQGALEDPIALPQPPDSALSNTLCKRQAAVIVLSMF